MTQDGNIGVVVLALAIFVVISIPGLFLVWRWLSRDEKPRDDQIG